MVLALMSGGDVGSSAVIGPEERDSDQNEDERGTEILYW